VGLLICVAVSALVIGWVTRGSLEHLSLVPLRGWPLVLGAVVALGVGSALTAVGGAVAISARIAGPLIAAACVLTLLVRNRSVEGVPLLAAGLLLNAVVITANGAMPVSLYAESRAGLSNGALLRADDATHEIADSSTRLNGLGDVVPVPLPIDPETVSVGDLLIVSGVGLLIVAGMHRRRDEERVASVS
jgi:hypothetical protein